MSRQERSAKKLTGSVAAIVVLTVCLCITTFALINSAVSVENNRFETGRIKINLNDGKPVIEENEFLFEPGMTVEKKCFLENESTSEAYYRLYFENIEGGLADVLEVTVEHEGKKLLSRKMSELTKEKAGAVEDILKLKERKELTVRFHFPKEAGNEAKKLYVRFDMRADAVQTRNNPDRIFE